MRILVAALLSLGIAVPATLPARAQNLNDIGRQLQDQVLGRPNPDAQRRAYDQGRRDAEDARRDDRRDDRTEDRRRDEDRRRANDDRRRDDRDRQRADDARRHERDIERQRDDRRRAYEGDQRTRPPLGR